MLRSECRIERRTSHARRARGSSLTLGNEMMIPFIALLVAVAAGAVVVVLLRRVDVVLSEIYARDRARWDELGKPTGFFWRPKEPVPFWKSVGARNALVVSALLSPHELLRPTEPKA
jgi:hypothetical protein